MSGLADRFWAALRVPDGTDPQDDLQPSIDRTHRVLADALSAAAPAAQVTVTRFFNHSFIPDAVLAWPDGRQRHVFLRFCSPTDPLLAQDLDYAGASSPGAVFLCLRHRDAATATQALAAAERHGCLVLSASALDVSGHAERVLRDGVGLVG